MGIRDDQALDPERDNGAVLLRNFLGINNVDEEDRLDFRFLRDAVNLDLSRQGRLRRRRGRTTVHTGAVRKLWSNGSRVLFSTGAAIYDLLRSASGVHSTAAVRSDTGADAFVDAEGEIYFSASGRLGHLVTGFPVDYSEANTHGQIFGDTPQPFYPGAVASENPASIEDIQRRFLKPMVGGKKLAHYRGRIYAAIGRFLYFTDPLRYLYYQPDVNYLMFDSDITLLAATPETLVVATSKMTWRLAGNRPAEFQRQQIFGYGTPDTEAVNVPLTQLGLNGDGDGLVWFSNKGMCVATPSGARNLTEARVAYPSYDQVAATFREQRGHRQVLTSGRSKGDVGFGIGDQATAEIRRNGVVIP